MVGFGLLIETRRWLRVKTFRYLDHVTTLTLNVDACIGCGECTRVCPHAVFEHHEKKARIRDRDACMECGACALNCPTGALSVSPGVGCAAYIIRKWLKGPDRASCGPGCC